MNKKAWILERDLTNPYKRIHYLHRGPFFMDSHCHDFWQLILVTDGQLHLKTSSDTAPHLPFMYAMRMMPRMVSRQ